MNSVQELSACGQSVWLDYLSRDIIKSGELRRLIDEDGISGVTTNPSIFQAAISGGRTYREGIIELAKRGLSAESIAEHLVIEDVVAAADVLLPLHRRTGGREGFVSVELSPRLAYDREGTIHEARSTWKAVARPNAMIKVPATSAGISATRQLLAEGINVNCTLLFWLGPYRRVQEAYLSALESRAVMGLPLESVASVASFFLSRIDSQLDPLLAKIARGGAPEAPAAAALRGEVATACARLAYQDYEEAFSGSRFQGLAARGARAQRLLWASTSTKNPAYSDIKYVEPLVGRNTVTTLPPETLRAFLAHGTPRIGLGNGVGMARAIIENIGVLGIDMEWISKRLERDGVDKFAAAFAALVKNVSEASTPATALQRHEAP